MVTRPREQASQLQQRISQLGGAVILFPLLEISPPPEVDTLRSLVSRLSEFDVAIFISPNAVRYGMAVIEQSGGLPAGLKLAAVGQGSAKALQALGVTEVIAPTDRFDSEALLAMPQLQAVSSQNIMIFRGDGGRELLGDTLKQRGASVEYATCYQRSKSSQKTEDLFVQGEVPDALTVSSSEALTHLWEMLSESERRKIASIPLFVPHQRIANVAQQQGWQQVVQTPSGDDGVVSSLLAWAKRKS